MDKQKLYTFTLDNSENTKQGILISEGDEWILLKSIFSDYIMDGYSLMHKKYIIQTNRDDNEVFIENVLKANNKWVGTSEFDILLETDSLLTYIKENQIIIETSSKKQNVIYVGKIAEIKNKIFYMHLLSPRGKWLDKTTRYKKEDIRVININTDYTNSLINYNKLHEHPLSFQ